MVNLEEILNKIKLLKNISKKKEIAELLGISPQDFSARVKRDTILPLIVNWAINENVNLDWLVKGEVETSLAPQKQILPIYKEEPILNKLVKEPTTSYNVSSDQTEDREITELLEMTRQVLKSKTGYADSLCANVRSFYTAIETEKRLSSVEKRMEIMEKTIISELREGDRRKKERRDIKIKDPVWPPDKNRRKDQDRRKFPGRRESDLAK